MQCTLRKIKQHLDKNQYKRMYPTGSRPGLFYTTAKVTSYKVEMHLMN